jgi:hypothetical protein
MGGSQSESRVSAVASDASSMLSPELTERSSRKKNVIANRYEWTTFGREVTPDQAQDENRFSARGSFEKMRQKFDAPQVAPARNA